MIWQFVQKGSVPFQYPLKYIHSIVLPIKDISGDNQYFIFLSYLGTRLCATTGWGALKNRESSQLQINFLGLY